MARKFTRLKCRLMPYLYEAALRAHETGLPLLRPMMLAFPGDIAAENCDAQYMLGDNLLVAPVMHSDGHVDYYLPDGVWTNLLTGKTVAGGGYRRETHDFHSLPLMVRENSVLAMGRIDTRPDYDFRDGVTLHVFRPRDGILTVRVPDERAKTCAAFTLHIHGDAVNVETDSELPYSVEVHW